MQRTMGSEVFGFVIVVYGCLIMSSRHSIRVMVPIEQREIVFEGELSLSCRFGSLHRAFVTINYLHFIHCVSTPDKLGEIVNILRHC